MTRKEQSMVVFLRYYCQVRTHIRKGFASVGFELQLVFNKPTITSHVRNLQIQLLISNRGDLLFGCVGILRSHGARVDAVSARRDIPCAVRWLVSGRYVAISHGYI